MTKFNKILNSKTLPGIFMFLAIVAAIFHRSCRQNWVYITAAVGINLPAILLGVMILCSIMFGVFFIFKLNDSPFCSKKAYRVLTLIGAVFTIILFTYAAIYVIGYAPGEASEVFSLYLSKTLSEGALLLIVPFFAVFYPKLTCKIRKIVAGVSVAAVVLFGINAYYPLNTYKITADPLVVDNGTEYSIVFSTSGEGDGYVEYTYEGKEYKVFDNVGGRLSTGKIHSIPVPYEHLRNNSYKVGSARVIEDYSYGSRRGKSVSSQVYQFKYNDSDDQTWLVISDWHTKTKKATASINNLNCEYDAVILLGDSTPGVDFEQQVITTIVEFGGKVSGGTKPVLYVRGNHETRGSYADELPAALGIDEFYYTSDIGPYSFVVLDSGEDKEDSHIEYGGMTDYATYRADMIDWLKGVKLENEKVIALSHAWQISEVEAELSQDGWAELDRLGTRLIISGHEHSCRFIGDGEGYEQEIKEKYPDIIGYIDGGKVGDTYVASLLTLNEDGLHIRAVDDSGNEIKNESFDW